MPMAKLALAGLVCFLAGVAWIAIALAEFYRRMTAQGDGIGVIVGVPRAAELLCLVGFVLLIGAGLFALVKTIRRRFNA
jgi:hypothetical protein